MTKADIKAFEKRRPLPANRSFKIGSPKAHFDGPPLLAWHVRITEDADPDIAIYWGGRTFAAAARRALKNEKGGYARRLAGREAAK